MSASAGKPKLVYHYKKNRKQRSRLFVRMACVSFVYVACIFAYEHYANQSVAEPLRSLCIAAFTGAGLLLLYIAWWHRANPASYEAWISNERFKIQYPDSEQWSFDLKLCDITRFEHRQSRSGGAQGIAETGVVTSDGKFYPIVMNYGNSVTKMHAAVASLRPEVTFSSKVAIR